MIELISYISFLVILEILIVFFLRQKGSYFRSVQILFLTAFISFLTIVLLDLIKNYLVISESVIFFTTKIGVSAMIIAAVAVEHAALMLYKKGEENFPWKSNLPSIIYKGYAICILLLTWILTPWQTKSVRYMWGGMVYIPEYEWWYFASLIGVFAAFVAYPCRLFVLSSRKHKEKSIADALTWLGACWMSIGVTLIIWHGLLRLLGYEMVEIGYSLDVLYFGIIAYLFKKTTILEGFFEKSYSPIRVRGGESVFVTYTSKSDKMKIFSAYIRDGLLGGGRVIYKYPDDEEEAVRQKLKEHGIDIESYEKNGSLILTTLSQFYLSDGFFNEEKAIAFLSELKAESIRKGYTQLRDFVDLSDFSFLGEDVDKYIEYLNDERRKGYLGDAHVTELFAVNKEKVSERHLRELTTVYSAMRVTHSIDLIEDICLFSRALGLTHKEITGKNILFEFDPASNYEKVIQDYVTETLANAEPVTVFTHKGSVIHSTLSKQEDLRFLLLTQRVSTPETDASTNEILLPANNTSLLLDTLDKTLETCPHGNLNVVFDSLSSLVLSIGFEKTYSFTRYAAEMLAAPSVTALFLLNPTAHDEKIVSGLRDLFSNHIAYGKEGLQVVRWPETEVDTVLKPMAELLLARKRVEER